MSMNCGIVGLPNVGKTTIFQALTSKPAEVGSYQFSTVNPNVARIDVPDLRLQKISSLIPSQKTTPANIEFVDIAGLVKGASGGEGLGNRFLAHVREAGVLCHVVRCFASEDDAYNGEIISPAEDIETVNMELALADLDVVDRRLERLPKLLRSPDKDQAKRARQLESLLQRLRKTLDEGGSPAELSLSSEDLPLFRELQLLTSKKQILVCNIDEAGIEGENQYVNEVLRVAPDGTEVIAICGKLEAEIALLEDEGERGEFLRGANLQESGLSRLIRIGYSTLGLRTFFTVGKDENRAWTFKEGALAPEAAGLIHSDFQRGFIKAEVYDCEDLFSLGGEEEIRRAGKLRLEGKNYRVNDGDVIHFRFNV